MFALAISSFPRCAAFLSSAVSSSAVLSTYSTLSLRAACPTSHISRLVALPRLILSTESSLPSYLSSTRSPSPMMIQRSVHRPCLPSLFRHRGSSISTSISYLRKCESLKKRAWSSIFSHYNSVSNHGTIFRTCFRTCRESLNAVRRMSRSTESFCLGGKAVGQGCLQE